MTTIAEGNGADAVAPPKRKRPRSSRISCFITYRCHHRVSVRAGILQTTVAWSLWAASKAFAIQAPMPWL